MTPRLRIPSSPRKEQRSLSPSLPLSFFSSPPEMCHSLLLSSHSLYNCRCCLHFLSLSSVPTHRSAHTKMTFDIFRNLKSPCMRLKTMKTLMHKRAQLRTQTHTNASSLTPLSLRRATHGCTGRRSTPPQHDGAPLLMPSGPVERHKPAQRL